MVNDGEPGLGVVARNARGQLLMAGVRRVHANWSAELSELLAAALQDGDCSQVGVLTLFWKGIVLRSSMATFVIM